MATVRTLCTLPSPVPRSETGAGLAVARRIEAAEARSAVNSAIARRSWIPKIHIQWEWFGPACAVFAGHWTHLTQALVTASSLTRADVARIEEFFRAYKAIPTILCSDLFDTTAIRRHGFELLGGSDVLVLPRGPSPSAGPRRAMPVRPNDLRARSEWLTMNSAACLGRELQNSHELEIGGIVSRMSNTDLFSVRVGGHAAAGGALFVDGGVGILFCDATLPEYRGNGFHRDLINARLDAAWEAGCTLAAATVERGSASARNYIRCGFRRAYSRLTLQRA